MSIIIAPGSPLALLLLFLVDVDSFQHLFAALDGRLGILLPVSKLSSQFDIPVLALITAKHTVDGFVFLSFNN